MVLFDVDTKSAAAASVGIEDTRTWSGAFDGAAAHTDFDYVVHVPSAMQRMRESLIEEYDRWGDTVYSCERPPLGRWFLSDKCQPDISKILETLRDCF